VSALLCDIRQVQTLHLMDLLHVLTIVCVLVFIARVYTSSTAQHYAVELRNWILAILLNSDSVKVCTSALYVVRICALVKCC
jgi:uncharacterized membrane protein YesL